MCMFCFHNLPHKGAKGQSQRQRHELARTSGQIARLAYRGGEHSPSYPEPSCGFLLPFLPALPPSHAPKGSGRSGHSPPGRNLSSAHPRRALSNITLLFQTHQGRWTPATEPQIPPFHARPGLWTTFLLNQPAQRHRLTARSRGVSRVLLGGRKGVREPATEGGRVGGITTAEVFKAGKLRLKTPQGHGTPYPLHTPSSSAGITEGLGIWNSSL